MYVIALGLYSFKSHAELINIEQGLSKIKKNALTSESNKSTIEKQLSVVSSNIDEIKKSKNDLLTYQKNINSDLEKNTDSMKKINTQEKEINNLIAIEKEKLITEDKQMQQLLNTINQIKLNQADRQIAIADYQNQLLLATQVKNKWQEREVQIKTQESSNNENLRKTASDEALWLSKKASYEKDLKKWGQETGRTKKIKDTFEGLVEGK